MTLYLGYTLTDYDTTIGFVPSTGTIDRYTTAQTIASSILTDLKTSMVATTKVMGGMSPIRGGLGGKTATIASSYLVSALNNISDTYIVQKEVAYTIADVTVKAQQQAIEMLQKDAHKVSELAVESGQLAQETAMDDRNRVKETTMQASEEAWKSAEAILDRAAKLALGVLQWDWEEDEGTLDKTSELALLMEQLRLNFATEGPKHITAAERYYRFKSATTGYPNNVLTDTIRRTDYSRNLQAYNWPLLWSDGVNFEPYWGMLDGW